MSNLFVRKNNGIMYPGRLHLDRCNNRNKDPKTQSKINSTMIYRNNVEEFQNPINSFGLDPTECLQQIL